MVVEQVPGQVAAHQVVLVAADDAEQAAMARRATLVAARAAGDHVTGSVEDRA
ncbi:MAG: hypothetical protein V9E94_14130 [Microthrixaceae bacterium]